MRKSIYASGWHPIGHAGYAELRRRIMGGELFDKELR